MRLYICLTFYLLCLAASLLAAPQKKKTGTKAASPYENYGCQCDNYTWRDTYGKIQGNCKSSDATRGRWCYVQGNYCDDIQYSKNRRDQYGQLRKWSYQACSTPAPGYGGGYGGGCNQRHGGCNGGYNNNRPNRPNIGSIISGALGGSLSVTIG